jgi:hypothetical protein
VQGHVEASCHVIFVYGRDASADAKCRAPRASSWWLVLALAPSDRRLVGLKQMRPLPRRFSRLGYVPRFVEHCEAVAAEIDVRRRWLGEQERRVSFCFGELPEQHATLEVAYEPSVVGSLWPSLTHCRADFPDCPPTTRRNYLQPQQIISSRLGRLPADITVLPHQCAADSRLLLTIWACLDSEKANAEWHVKVPSIRAD